MDFELSAHINGLHARQEVQNTAGDGAEFNETISGSDRTAFSEMLGKKLESQPATNVASTAAVKPDAFKSNVINTGNPLDLAIEGKGYFVLSDGQRNIYTRSGTFAVDVKSTLIETATGYKLQRIGSEGESDGFQTSGDDSIHIPYRAVVPAKMTSRIKLDGNLSRDITIVDGPKAQRIASNTAYTINGDNIAVTDTKICELDQFCNESGINRQFKAGESGTISISGYNPDGTELNRSLKFTVNSGSTLGDFINHLNTNVLRGATASLANGKIQITDHKGGYSRTDIKLSYSGSGSLTMPGYFEIVSVGGEEVRNVNITIYDSQGVKHALTGAFVRTNRPNTWDMLLSSVTGDVSEINMDNRRIENISFNSSDGSYAGLNGSNLPRFIITFGNDPAKPQTIEMELGNVGKLNGLTQFKGISTAAARGQNGYEPGRLSNVSVNNEGVIVGIFSNGIRKNIARLQMSLFENTSGLENIGGGFFLASPSAGEPTSTGATMDGAGIIHAGLLEKSKADLATDFADMIQSPNGFQANANIIKVANEILQELSRQMK